MSLSAEGAAGRLTFPPLRFDVLHLLSDTADFVGGGTGFRATATRPADGQAETMDVVRPTQGEMLSHFGQLYHTGVQVTGGTRYILAGFVGVESLATRWRELRRPQAGCGADAT